MKINIEATQLKHWQYKHLGVKKRGSKMGKMGTAILTANLQAVDFEIFEETFKQLRPNDPGLLPLFASADCPEYLIEKALEQLTSKDYYAFFGLAMNPRMPILFSKKYREGIKRALDRILPDPDCPTNLIQEFYFGPSCVARCKRAIARNPNIPDRIAWDLLEHGNYKTWRILARNSGLMPEMYEELFFKNDTDINNLLQCNKGIPEYLKVAISLDL